jgi:hypothetical protein
LAVDFVRIAKGIEIEDQESLYALRRLNPEDLYKLTTKIIDKSRDEHGAPRLQALSLVALLRKVEIDRASPATTMHPGSIAPIVTPQKGGAFRY